MEYVLQTNALGKSYGHFKALNGLLYCRPPGFTVVPPGKYLAGGLQSDCTANLTGVQYKIHLLRKSALEIERAFSERLTTDTNTLIAISSRDSTMRSLPPP